MELMESDTRQENIQEPIIIQENEVQIKMTDIAKAVQKLKVDKAAGIDDIRSEIIKYIGEERIKHLHKVILNAWNGIQLY